MTKFSNFIRSPGTAGPPTRQGIEDLGFVTDQDIPGILGKYVRVDAAQSFTGPEETQGRENIGAQQFSASLTSLAGLTTSANQIAYTTAADTWAVTSLSAFGRNLIDDADAAAARTTMGLGTIATQAANNVAITGGSISGITDLAVVDGGTGASTPAAARTSLGLVIGTDVQAQDAQLQAVADLTGAAGSFVRWTGASSAAMQAIVGTVSQSGGTPTGAIIESGSNANGRYVRYADGTQECWFEAAGSVTTSSTATNVFASANQTFTFPIAFSAAPIVTPHCRYNSGSAPWAAQGTTNPSTTGCSVILLGAQNSSSGFPGYRAIGRWF